MAPTRSQNNSVLRTMMQADRVLTTVQLERRGLLGVADGLDLPRVTLTCRTRVTQPHSRVNLTFVAFEEGLLARPPHVLMHDVGLAEGREQCPNLAGKTVQHLDLRGHARGHLPDAVYLAPNLQTWEDWAGEFDAGYNWERIEAKVRAADREGYASYLWATTVRARPVQIGALLRKIHALEPLLHLRHVEARFVDFWSQNQPYQTSRRTHKRLSETYESPSWVAVAQ